MAAIDPVSAKKQYELYFRMLCGLGLVALISSFVEADQRGLLFAQDNFAFVADDVALAVPNGSTGPLVSYVQYPGRGLQQRAPRRGGRNTASSGFAGLPVASIITPPGSGAARNIDAVPGDLASVLPAATQPVVPTPSVNPRGPSGTSFGFPDSPLGLVPVATQPGPVVPAVPEPASWLLMIIGVGWLGLYLRRHERREAFAF